jgi:hypothetical protein
MEASKMTKDEILKRCEQWFAAYMHDRESYDEATQLLAAIRNRDAAEPGGDVPTDGQILDLLQDPQGSCECSDSIQR